jgi:hypothetical protein
MSATAARAVHFACEAKFLAESSGYVGKDAGVVTIHRPADRNERVKFFASTGNRTD